MKKSRKVEKKASAKVQRRWWSHPVAIAALLIAGTLPWLLILVLSSQIFDP